MLLIRHPEQKILQQLHGQETEDLTLIEMGPFGVIGAITPCTNPSETVLCNTMGMLAGGNTVVFNPHPAAVKTSIYAINLLNEASLETRRPGQYRSYS